MSELVQVNPNKNVPKNWSRCNGHTRVGSVHAVPCGKSGSTPVLASFTNRTRFSSEHSNSNDTTASLRNIKLTTPRKVHTHIHSKVMPTVLTIHHDHTKTTHRRATTLPQPHQDTPHNEETNEAAKTRTPTANSPRTREPADCAVSCTHHSPLSFPLSLPLSLPVAHLPAPASALGSQMQTQVATNGAAQ